MLSRFILGVLLLGLASQSATKQTPTQPTDVRVMTFNIRYGTANDGENHWDKRRDFLIDTIKAFDPDLLGTQETLGFQRDYLAEKLKEYDVLGVGRDDGREAGEMMALYFKRSRFEKIDGGHFWLSETPDNAGSKSWDTSLPRMVTWVKLRDRKQRNARPIAFFNTHFDHRGREARLQSAKLIRRRVLEAVASGPVIVTGDFNTGEGTEPYAALFGDENGRKSPVMDTYRLAHPKRESNEGTFSNFAAGINDGPRIDWIAVSSEWSVVSSEIDLTQRAGRFPSDHFPVTAILRLGRK